MESFLNGAEALRERLKGTGGMKGETAPLEERLAERNKHRSHTGVPLY
jgi:hypothetical protein